jgi:4-carboxymuconolactone decarboxylase
MASNNPIFAKGEKASADFFIGTAWVNMLVAEGDTQVYDVLFEPGARNNWHSHAAGQILLCTDGAGCYTVLREKVPIHKWLKVPNCEFAPF